MNGQLQYSVVWCRGKNDRIHLYFGSTGRPTLTAISVSFLLLNLAEKRYFENYHANRAERIQHRIVAHESTNLDHSKILVSHACEATKHHCKILILFLFGGSHPLHGWEVARPHFGLKFAN